MRPARSTWFADLRLVALILVAFGLLAPLAASAQGRAEAGLSLPQSQRAAQTLASLIRTCDELDPIYQPDCLRHSFGQTARQISNNPAYWEAEVALVRVRRLLDDAVRQYADPEAPRVRAAGARLRAVAPLWLELVAGAQRSAVQRAEGALRSGSAEEISYFEPLADVLSDAIRRGAL